ncbi:hypothetical protein CK203_089432 [Vitis vinifera]|uniref:Uncharacterized protein n=1 Tax=Vitis vinifera TaxID=29760 RepID=A0A438E912_VITVI|nr:hypothetical protein CK203_089432 [Vitis vinifera]
MQVSKDVKYADKQPIVPWAPRSVCGKIWDGKQSLCSQFCNLFRIVKFTKSSVNDMRINMAISAVFTAWILIKRNAEWKPLQFLAFAYVYRIFEKLKAFEPPVSPTFTEDGEDEGRTLRMGKRLLRSLALVFSCIAVSSLVGGSVFGLLGLGRISLRNKALTGKCFCKILNSSAVKHDNGLQMMVEMSVSSGFLSTDEKKQLATCTFTALPLSCYGGGFSLVGILWFAPKDISRIWRFQGLENQWMRQLCLLISVPMNEEFTGIPMSIIAIDWKVAVGLKTVSNLGIESHSGKIFLGHYLLGCFFEE